MMNFFCSYWEWENVGIVILKFRWCNCNSDKILMVWFIILILIVVLIEGWVVLCVVLLVVCCVCCDVCFRFYGWW